MFLLVSRHLERVYREGLVTEAKTKDKGTEDKQGLVWFSQDQTYWDTYITPEKGGGYMNLEEIYVRACIWRTEINYLENKNCYGWVQLWWTVCNWGMWKGLL